MMSSKAPDEENGEQNARLVPVFADVAVVFTLARSPLCSLCVGEIGMKLGCVEGHVQVRTGPL